MTQAVPFAIRRAFHRKLIEQRPNTASRKCDTSSQRLLCIATSLRVFHSPYDQGGFQWYEVQRGFASYVFSQSRAEVPPTLRVFCARLVSLDQRSWKKFAQLFKTTSVQNISDQCEAADAAYAAWLAWQGVAQADRAVG